MKILVEVGLASMLILECVALVSAQYSKEYSDKPPRSSPGPKGECDCPKVAVKNMTLNDSLTGAYIYYGMMFNGRMKYINREGLFLYYNAEKWVIGDSDGNVFAYKEDSKDVECPAKLKGEWMVNVAGAAKANPDVMVKCFECAMCKTVYEGPFMGEYKLVSKNESQCMDWCSYMNMYRQEFCFDYYGKFPVSDTCAWGPKPPKPSRKPKPTGDWYTTSREGMKTGEWKPSKAPPAAAVF